MIIYTYFDPRVCDTLGTNRTVQDQIIAEWRRSWQRQGWRPIVLTASHARAHPLDKQFCDRVRTYPTTNKPEYELVCFRRWLALDRVGGGWMTDYDVINHYFSPRKGLWPVKMLDPTYVPCAVWANQNGAKAIVRAMMEYTVPAGCTHVSDMLVFKSHFDKKTFGPPSNQVLEFGVGNWKDAPLVHFPSSKCGTDNKLWVIQNNCRWL